MSVDRYDYEERYGERPWEGADDDMKCPNCGNTWEARLLRATRYEPAEVLNVSCARCGEDGEFCG